eukprot:GFUD01038587.1.p1 GENE.GFUD01038587.1~~GFUD01038587.1.p1  ORF type:complete len:515 (+),score=206.48 GFUD01038587.1:102-1646(+)
MLGGPSRGISSLRRGRSRSRGGEAWKMFQRSLVPDQQDTVSDDHIEGSEEEDQGSDDEMSDQEKRQLPVRKARLQNMTDESEDSDDESERAKRKRALRAFKEARSSSKKGSRIKGRPVEDNTDTEEDEVEKAEIDHSRKQLKFPESEQNKVEGKKDENVSDCSLSGPSFPRKIRRVKMKTRRIISDSEDSEYEEDDEGGDENSEGDDNEESDDSFIDDGDSSKEADSQEVNANDDWADMLENLKRRGDKFTELTSQYEESVECRQLGGYDLSDDEDRENKYPPRLLDDLREAVEAASKDDGVEVAPELNDDNNKLIQRWEMYDVAESKAKEGECVCGRTGLRWLYFMRVKGLPSWPFHTRVVGSECIRWFCRGNPRSVLTVFTRLLKEGCVATFQQQLDTKCLLFTLGGNLLPPFLREHKEFHQREYTVPVVVHEEDERVDIIVKPATRGRVRDEGGKLLVKGGKYQLWVKPAVRPCKDTTQVPVLDFVLVKVQDSREEREGGGKEKTGKDFIK